MHNTEITSCFISTILATANIDVKYETVHVYIDQSLFPRDFVITEQSLVSIPAQQTGGNHAHPRKEAYMTTSPDLVLYWRNEKGEKQEERMFDGNQLTLFVMYPKIPHAILNKSSTAPALLYEFADDLQHDITPVKVI